MPKKASNHPLADIQVEHDKLSQYLWAAEQSNLSLSEWVTKSLDKAYVRSQTPEYRHQMIQGIIGTCPDIEFDELIEMGYLDEKPVREEKKVRGAKSDANFRDWVRRTLEVEKIKGR